MVRLKNINKNENGERRILNPINSGNLTVSEANENKLENLGSVRSECDVDKEDSRIESKNVGLVEKENGELGYQRKTMQYMEKYNKKITTEGNSSENSMLAEKIDLNGLDNEEPLSGLLK